MSSIAEEYPKEQARVRAAVAAGREIGPVGVFYVTMGEDLLRRADEAMASGYVTQIVALYQEMTEFKS